jgi:hypothetical protein
MRLGSRTITIATIKIPTALNVLYRFVHIDEAEKP